MKKTLLLIALAVCFAFSACTSGGVGDDNNNKGDLKTKTGVYVFNYLEIFNGDSASQKFEVGQTLDGDIIFSKDCVLTEQSSIMWLLDEGVVYIPTQLIGGDYYLKGQWSETSETHVDLVANNETINIYCDGETLILDLEEIKITFKKANLADFPLPSEDKIVSGDIGPGESETIYSFDGNYVSFGKFPQTLKSAEVTITQTVNTEGYYLGSDNEWYAKVTATPRLPNSYKFSNGEIIETGKEYYFKLENIKWQIVAQDNNNYSLVSVNVLKNMAFANMNNNYKNSSIRSWLNSDFYDLAFTEGQQQIIQIVSVDNSASSTNCEENQYVCDDTEDKVYLLSYAEAFALTSSVGMTELRAKKATDYAMATGIIINTSDKWYGYANWWLRSPHDDENNYVPDYFTLYVNSIGLLGSRESVGTTSYGVAPALQIRIG